MLTLHPPGGVRAAPYMPGPSEHLGRIKGAITLTGVEFVLSRVGSHRSCGLMRTHVDSCGLVSARVELLYLVLVDLHGLS